MITLTGKVDRFLFKDDDSGYAVVCLRTDGQQTFTVQGMLSGIKPGQKIICEGEEVMTKYGRQLKVKAWSEILPTDIEGIESYLASGMIKNIGPVLAHQIVEHFRMDTLRVLDEEPWRISEIRGIGKKRVESIAGSVSEQKDMRSIMVWLKRYDLSNGLSKKIYKEYGKNSVHVLQDNPYILADELDGIGFKRADLVARQIGIAPDSASRIRSGLRHCVKDFTDMGSTYIPEQLMLSKTASCDYLGIAEEIIEKEYSQWKDECNFSKEFIVEEGCVYPRGLYEAERSVAERLKRLCTIGQDELFGHWTFFRGITHLETLTHVTYNYKQKQAIEMAAQYNVLVLTGGPGTGKTLTTNGIIKMFESEGMRVSLCAPTGRAARRMSEVTGRPASTIHRLLGFPRDGFCYNEKNPLPGDAVIVDESSMIDICLMDSLMRAIPVGMKLILVGDVDQLASVGSGSVLRDIINSAVVPMVRLTDVYRQAQGSQIIMGAHAVNSGRMPHLNNEPGTDLLFIEKSDREEVAKTIVDLMTVELPRKYFPSEIQILSPMRRDGDPIGVTQLNSRIQSILNPASNGLRHAGRDLREGDKVMQIKNDYDKNVFNGDIGHIVYVNPSRGNLTVDFDGNRVDYEKDELAMLDLAYATTVHKSQGSEYPVVIMPVEKSHYVMLKRNLLYTGITRARKLCILIGTRDAISLAVRREDSQNRYSKLAEKLLG